MAYWRIGQRIVQEEQQGNTKADYGAYIIKEISIRLTDEFGRGFNIPNIKNFRQFYLTFPKDAIGYAVRSQLTWTHYRSIMRVQNPNARQYYIKEAADNNWSTRQLERNINTLYYERLLSTQNSESETRQPSPESPSPKDLIKDPYVLEFLDLPRPKEYSESELETAIISHL